MNDLDEKLSEPTTGSATVYLDVRFWEGQIHIQKSVSKDRAKQIIELVLLWDEEEEQ